MWEYSRRLPWGFTVSERELENSTRDGQEELEDTEEDVNLECRRDSRAFGERGWRQCWCAVNKDTWSALWNECVTSCLLLAAPPLTCLLGCFCYYESLCAENLLLGSSFLKGQLQTPRFSIVHAWKGLKFPMGIIKVILTAVTLGEAYTNSMSESDFISALSAAQLSL